MKQLSKLSILTFLTASSCFAMGAPADGAQPSNPMGMVVMIGGVFAIMYFFMIRPQKKQQQKKQEMLNNIKPGDRIMTSGGIFGEVKQLKDNTVRVQIDDHARIEISKSAIVSIIVPEDKN